MRIFQLLFFCFAINITAHSQTKAQQIEKVMSTLHQYGLFDGSVLVVDEGKIIYNKAFGQANREWNIPNTTDTRFMIGSISKSFTSMLALLQIQKGKLKLDGQLKDYLPEFANSPMGSITVEQLMKNSGGVANYEIIADFFPRISRQFYKPEDYVKVYKDSVLISKPGEAYHYSSWGFLRLVI